MKSTNTITTREHVMHRVPLSMNYDKNHRVISHIPKTNGRPSRSGRPYQYEVNKFLDNLITKYVFHQQKQQSRTMNDKPHYVTLTAIREVIGYLERMDYSVADYVEICNELENSAREEARPLTEEVSESVDDFEFVDYMAQPA